MVGTSSPTTPRFSPLATRLQGHHRQVDLLRWMMVGIQQRARKLAGALVAPDALPPGRLRSRSLQHPSAAAERIIIGPPGGRCPLAATTLPTLLIIPSCARFTDASTLSSPGERQLDADPGHTSRHTALDRSSSAIYASHK